MIQNAVKEVKESHGIDIDINNIGDDDPEVYKLISSGNTKVFFSLKVLE